jgi:hypothetical protein
MIDNESFEGAITATLQARRNYVHGNSEARFRWRSF